MNWRPVRPDDAEQVAAHGCYRDEDAARRPACAAWLGPRIEAGRYIGWLAVDGGAATPEARPLYLSLGFTDYPAEMRRRLPAGG